ncbi:hypothetical protein SNEBB_000051 [Seison nebaliae]|nr:hypothetical protein SNEBB_000051 [Seison nebaliae]
MHSNSTEWLTFIVTDLSRMLRLVISQNLSKQIDIDHTTPATNYRSMHGAMQFIVSVIMVYGFLIISLMLWKRMRPKTVTPFRHSESNAPYALHYKRDEIRKGKQVFADIHHNKVESKALRKYLSEPEVREKAWRIYEFSTFRIRMKIILFVVILAIQTISGRYFPIKSSNNQINEIPRAKETRNDFSQRSNVLESLVASYLPMRQLANQYLNAQDAQQYEQLIDLYLNDFANQKYEDRKLH